MGDEEEEEEEEEEGGGGCNSAVKFDRALTIWLQVPSLFRYLKEILKGMNRGILR